MSATKLIFVVLLIVLLSACAVQQEIPDAPKEALIGVATKCVKESDLPPKPEIMADALLAVMTDDRLVFTIARERLLMKAYIMKLEALLETCIAKGE